VRQGYSKKRDSTPGAWHGARTPLFPFPFSPSLLLVVCRVLYDMYCLYNAPRHLHNLQVWRCKILQRSEEGDS
jgi:hypothetical protein